MSGRNKLWARMGMTLSVTPQEAEKIIHGSSVEQSQILTRIFSEGRAGLDGDCYIPRSVLLQYNRAHGTQYLANDIDLDIGFLDGKALKIESAEAMKTRPKPKDRGEH